MEEKFITLKETIIRDSFSLLGRDYVILENKAFNETKDGFKDLLLIGVVEDSAEGSIIKEPSQMEYFTAMEYYITLKKAFLNLEDEE